MQNGFTTTRLLSAALVMLLIDSTIELALICSMVAYLHWSEPTQYSFTSDSGNSTLINAKPAHLLLNEGHTSNGAAGTALVLVCFGGFIILWICRREEREHTTRRFSKIFLAYTILTILSTGLTLSALAYTFAVTNQTDGQRIDQTVVAQFEGHAYPVDNWTPTTWTQALLALPITSNTDVHHLRHWLRIMEGWK